MAEQHSNNYEFTKSKDGGDAEPELPLSSPSAGVTETSKPKRPLTTEDKRERKRQINRLSAQRKREREREQLDTLTDRQASLNYISGALKADNCRLRILVNDLRQALSAHPRIRKLSEVNDLTERKQVLADMVGRLEKICDALKKCIGKGGAGVGHPAGTQSVVPSSGGMTSDGSQNPFLQTTVFLTDFLKVFESHLKVLKANSESMAQTGSLPPVIASTAPPAMPNRNTSLPDPPKTQQEQFNDMLAVFQASANTAQSKTTGQSAVETSEAPSEVRPEAPSRAVPEGPQAEGLSPMQMFLASLAPPAPVAPPPPPPPQNGLHQLLSMLAATTAPQVPVAPAVSPMQQQFNQMMAVLTGQSVPAPAPVQLSSQQQLQQLLTTLRSGVSAQPTPPLPVQTTPAPEPSQLFEALRALGAASRTTGTGSSVAEYSAPPVAPNPAPVPSSDNPQQTALQQLLQSLQQSHNPYPANNEAGEKDVIGVPSQSAPHPAVSSSESKHADSTTTSSAAAERPLPVEKASSAPAVAPAPSNPSSGAVGSAEAQVQQMLQALASAGASSGQDPNAWLQSLLRNQGKDGGGSTH